MSTAGDLSGTKPRFFQLPVEQQERHVDDWYVEPRWSVDVLLRADGVVGPAWDPACGGGTIPTAVTAHGKLCWASDIADRGVGTRHDFLGPHGAPYAPVATIITNPPYGLAQEFVERALTIATERVAVLVQAKFPYSQRRHALFSQHPPARIYFLSDRPSMPPGDLLRDGKIKAQGGKMDFCWIVWDCRNIGPTTAHWLRRAR